MESNNLFFGLGSVLILLIILSMFGIIGDRSMKPKKDVVVLRRPPVFAGGNMGPPPYYYRHRRRHFGP